MEPSDCIEIIFKGLADKPGRHSDAETAVITCLPFLQQLAAADRLFALAFQDHAAECSQNTAEQTVKNWRALGVALFDHGYEVSDESTFAILSGQLAVAAQLSNDIQRIGDRGHQRSILQVVGPAVPVRQRVHPFRGVTVAATGKSVVAPPTRIFMVEQPRFAKKRAICIDNMERLRDKEHKAQKLREKKEREAQQKAMDTQKQDGSKDARAQDQYIQESMSMYRDDPQKMAEKSKRTELLRELERLETAYSYDERRMAKLRQQTHVDSPRRIMATQTALAHTQQSIAAVSEKRGRLSPMRLREESEIPFSSTPQAQPRKQSKPVKQRSSHPPVNAESRRR